MPETHSWDIEGAEKALHSQAKTCYDPLCGEGYYLSLSQSPEASKPQVGIYPEKSIVRYRDLNTVIDLVNVQKFMPEQDRLRVEVSTETMRTTAFFPATGSIVLSINPFKEQAKARDQEAPAEPAPKEAEPAKEDKNKDRVTLTGRIGKDLEVKETKNGKKVLKVPVAVHEDNQTTWHSVFFFGDKAESMAGSFSKGQTVTVVGYKHEHETTVKGKNGPEKRLVEVIYGAVMQAPKK